MVRLNTLDPRAPTLSPSAVRVAGIQFLASDQPGLGVAGTLTKDIILPAYSLLIDVYVHNAVLWTQGTSAALDVGLFDEDGVAIDADYYFSALNLKATDLLADESVSFGFAGGDNGVGLATSTHVLKRFSTAPRILRSVVTTAGTASLVGKTFVFAEYAVCELDSPTYAA